jgi:N-acetylmuramic acid 6-phosphate etherase
MHATLRSPRVREDLAKIIALEQKTYRTGHKHNYFANRFGIDVLTDTTERSPTYCTPPFRKYDDTNAASSWAFLFVGRGDTPSAWEHVIKRKPRCVEWSEAEVKALVDSRQVPRTLDTLRKISYAELLRFKIGLDGLGHRRLGPADSAIAIVSESEKAELLSPTGFHRARLEEAHRAGATIGLIYLGRKESLDDIRQFLTGWIPDCIALLVPVPGTDFLLDGVTRAGLKMLLNALSTCTMVRLGRVMGNYMIWVVPSNLKLIDRSTRYVQKLSNLEYRAANELLFEVIEYVEPRMKVDQAYPPVVGVAVVRARDHVSNELAEERLLMDGGNSD